MAAKQLDGDLTRVMDVVSAIAQSRATGPGLPDLVLQRLAALIPAECVSFTEFDLATMTTGVDQDCIAEQVAVNVRDAAAEDPFLRYYWSTEYCSYPSRTGDARSVIQRSDFYSDRVWHNMPMFVECFRADGVDHSLLCCISDDRARTRRVVFFRSGTGFSERERQLLTLVRPHLAEAFRAQRDAPAVLTDRQRDLLRLVATGHTNAEIASRLYVSPHTVRKHLENIYERLGVTTRTAAIAHAFPNGSTD